MKQLERNVLYHEHVLIFLEDEVSEVELVAQGSCKDTRRLTSLPIQLEPCEKKNYFTIRYARVPFAESMQVILLMNEVFELDAPWTEPGYLPKSISNQNFHRKE